MAMAAGCKPVDPLGHGVFDSLTLNHFLLGCLSIGRKGDSESSNRGSSPRAPTSFGLLRQWQTTRLLSAGMKVQILRGPPILAFCLDRIAAVG